MKYETQKIALYYFWGALALFAAQVLVGCLAGLVYVSPNFLAELVPFHIIRMIHTNALVVWLIMGFFGATYYLFSTRKTTRFNPWAGIFLKSNAGQADFVEISIGFAI